MDLKQELNNQVNQIFSELGLDGLSEDQKEIIRKKILDRFESVTLEAVLVSLNEEDLAIFEKAITSENPDDTEAVITELVSTKPEIAARVNMAIKNEWEGIKKDFADKNTNVPI